ncbi:hypothetical protein vseg_020053 [Gypsophila vaccaria]
MSEYGGENNPHFRPRQRPDLDVITIPQNVQPEPMQPWDYHPTQIPQPDRIQPRPRSKPWSQSQRPIPVTRPSENIPEHDHRMPPPPMVHLQPPENAYAYPQPPTPPRHHQPTRHSRPVDIPPVHQPNRHFHPDEGTTGHQPTRHSRPVGAPVPPVYQDRPKPKPKPTRQSRPHHGASEHGPRHENLMYPEPSRTKPITWCGAVFCIILWLVVILGGLLVLVVYLLYRPRTPHFEISSATLNAVYLDMGYLLNADLTVLANFTNPNKKVHVEFSYVILQLFFDKHLIANQYIEPFSASKGENKFASVEMVTSQVRLPLAVTQKLVTQIQRNRIMFEVNGIFHARSNFGSLLRYSYWLYGHCNIEMTGPPSGIVISTKCYTKD